MSQKYNCYEQNGSNIIFCFNADRRKPVYPRPVGNRQDAFTVGAWVGDWGGGGGGGGGSGGGGEGGDAVALRNF